MRASELKSKLQGDLARTEGALAAMRGERLKLALPAASGDETAALRLIDLRADVAQSEAETKDLEQALRDVERLVAIEVAEAQYAERQRLLGKFEAACTVAGERLAALDTAMAGFVEAYGTAAEATAPIQALAVELLVPNVAGISVSMVMQRRSETLATVRLSELREQVDAVLPWEMSGRPRQSFADWFAEGVKYTDHRLRHVMRSDRARAVEAGATIAPEAA